MELSLTKKEAAKRLGVSERTVDYLRTAGKLACVKIGACVRFLPEDLEAFLQQRRVLLVPVEKKNP